jgi:hypothetical protein
MTMHFFAAGVPLENTLYLAAQTLLLRFIVRDNNDLITHEVMRGLKNIHGIDAGKFPFVVLSSD